MPINNTYEGSLGILAKAVMTYMHERMRVRVHVGALTQIDSVNAPPGLRVQVEWLCGEEVLGHRLVHAPQQLLGLALVHDGDVLIAPHSHHAHNIRGLSEIAHEVMAWPPWGA